MVNIPSFTRFYHHPRWSIGFFPSTVGPTCFCFCWVVTIELARLGAAPGGCTCKRTENFQFDTGWFQRDSCLDWARYIPGNSVCNGYVYIYNISLRIQSPCQMMIGVYNHLLSKVFRFHYHSQKVIGSLGYVQINYMLLVLWIFSVCTGIKLLNPYLFLDVSCT